jgi:hypothetical protein
MKIRSKYQKLIAVIGEVLAMVCLSHPHASSLVIGSGKKVMSKEIAIRKRINLKKIAVAKTPLCLEAIKEGIKACVKAPSAKIRRKRFGSLKAIKNISLHTEAPNAEAISTSRPNPVTLENKIPKLLVKIDFNLMFFSMLN